MQENELTHFDPQGRARIVDVSEKSVTARTAVASALIEMQEGTRRLIEERRVRKGDVLTVAELGAIMGAKRTADIIPLCHPLVLDRVDVVCDWELLEREQGPSDAPDHADAEGSHVNGPLSTKARLRITATVSVHGKTGVEMEALTACAAGALTVYDMCKAVDREMVIRNVQLLHKEGGKSGTFHREQAE